jgi:hypothetical protein
VCGLVFLRLDAAGCLTHPWVGEDNSKVELHMSAEKLKHFMRRRELRKVGAAYAAAAAAASIA